MSCLDITQEEIERAKHILAQLKEAKDRALSAQDEKSKMVLARASAEEADDRTMSNVQDGKGARLAIFFGYNGNGYHGMQLNRGVTTIEQAVHAALIKARILRSTTKMTGEFDKATADLKASFWNRAARTDKGVSAAGQVASFNGIMRPDMTNVMNSFLPEHIHVYGFREVTSMFDARVECSSRRYEYWLPEWVFDPDLVPEKPSWRPASVPKDAAVVSAGTKTLPGERIQQVQVGTKTIHIRPGYSTKARPTNSRFIFDAECHHRLDTILREYEGVHNFHNFTPGVEAEQMAAQRVMLSVRCAGVFDFGKPPNTERWVRMDIHGQSFLMNQIRKMVGLAVAVYRGAAPRNCIHTATDPNLQVGTPLAPELGLLLVEPVYDQYNKSLSKGRKSLKPLCVDDWKTSALYFKNEFIYEPIRVRDAAEIINYRFFSTLTDASFHFFKWSKGPTMGNLKRPRSREQKELSIERGKERQTRKDELTKEGLDDCSIVDILRKEFPRDYLKGMSDRPAKKRCPEDSTGAGCSDAKVTCQTQPKSQEQEGTQLHSQENRMGQPNPHDNSEARQASQENCNGQSGTVQCETGAVLAGTSEDPQELPNSAVAEGAAPAATTDVTMRHVNSEAATSPGVAANVAQIMRVDMPDGAAEDDGDAEEEEDEYGGADMDESGPMHLVDGAVQGVAGEAVAAHEGMLEGLQAVGGSDDDSECEDSDEEDQHAQQNIA